ncbi:MAG TPA: NAD(P)H-hydrate dehydratase, partial [Pyrinomonadaceae bacterium]|nr:NAD(P)H-hydrate dehydratase [Pyrinomonadaceae bacterium]
MQKVLTAKEMREVDRLTTEKYGIPSIILMENAAHAAARVINEKLGGSVKGKRFLVLCGKGNNGGDGAALARILWTQGASVQIFLFGKVEDTKGDARVNFEIAKKLCDEGFFIYGMNYIYFDEVEDYETFQKKSFIREDVCIDALFGTGLTRKVEGLLENVISGINHYIPGGRGQDSLIISIDLPSGLNSDSSTYYSIIAGGTEVKNYLFTATQPDLTITFTAPKLANVFPPVCHASKELLVVNIGSPDELISESPSKLFLAENSDAKFWLGNTQPRSNSYKKTRGRALIIAGSENYSGAAVLSANACFAAGAGIVTVAVPKEIRPIVSGKVSGELIVQTIDNIDVTCDVVGMGCGMSPDEKTHEFIRETVLNRKTPMVLDAQALNAFSICTERFSEEFPLVFTPHLGEFSRLLGREVGEDRIAEARDFAQKHNVILVLKGERSLIAKPDGTVVINPTGNAGVSRAGAGDTLAGIITSFIAQTLQTEHIR